MHTHTPHKGIVFTSLSHSPSNSVGQWYQTYIRASPASSARQQLILLRLAARLDVPYFGYINRCSCPPRSRQHNNSTQPWKMAAVPFCHPHAALTEFFIMEIIQRVWLDFNGTLSTETSTQKFGWCPTTPLGGVQVHHRRDHTTQAYRPTNHTTQGYRHTVSIAHISHFKVISKFPTPNK